MADIDLKWGTWHYKEPLYSQNGCIRFDYQINSYGARDKERTKRSKEDNRVIVLGDSYMEGYGIPEAKRFSNLLEKKTGKEFLNFSCADHGTTQEFLVYKYLASEFDHSTIFIGFLPFNDFENDDIHFLGDQKRYKPYFVKSDSGYVLEYNRANLEESDLNKDHYLQISNSFWGTITRILKGITCWYNIVDYFKNKKLQAAFFTHKKNKIVSNYYDYKPEQVEKLKFILTQLRKSAPDKTIIFSSIPVIPDIQRRAIDGEPPLPLEIANICNSLSITYVDLLPHFYKLKDYRNFFFFCDPHWNEKANKYVYEIMLPYF